MKFVELGKGKEKVSAIGLGCWQFGSKGWGYGRDFDKNVAIKLVHLAIDNGVNLFDTAEMYSSGKSEKILGEAIKERREEVFIASKVSPTHLMHGSLKKACERSLKRLGIKTIDLYQIHWPNPIVPQKSTIKALDELVDEGKIRHIGVSNYSVGRLKYAQELTKHEIVSNQVSYSLANLEIEEKLLPYCKETGVKVIAYSPLAQGLLTGKYTHENRLEHKGVRRINRLFSPSNLKKGEPLINKLKETAEKYGRTPPQLSLNFLISDGNVIAIPGAKSENQLLSNVGSADFELSAEEISDLREEAGKFHPSTASSVGWMLGLQR